MAHQRGHTSSWKLAIAALGIVYGDIGTSPLYALRECFNERHGVVASTENVFGILSLVFWALTTLITIKYLVFVLRADNKGEGGTLALLALLIPKLAAPRLEPSKEGGIRRTFFLVLLGLFGTALLYGDGVITPAISVLSAVEGLEVATPALSSYVVPITVLILIALFAVQRRGTASIGEIFGPVTLLWFAAITAGGVPWILQRPEILGAVNPIHALRFFAANGLQGFLVLGAVVLCVTGGEALYADMGHFGKRPIRLSWFVIVFPALLVNYFGQGALILQTGADEMSHPFYGLYPSWALMPMVALATAATVIASQALISGAYSLTQQAVQLGYLPRISILHTSAEASGQIYIPRVNDFLMVACIALVLAFQESAALASAYGIAVTGTMAITTVLFYNVTRQLWGWSKAVALPLAGVFLLIDLSFFSANAVKFFSGGWITFAIAIVLFAIMTTWKRGREVLSRAMLELAIPLDEFIGQIAREAPPRVKGTAVFMTLTRDIAPSVLLHHYRHNQILHERVILLSIVTKNEPDVDTSEHVRVTELEQGFVKIVARYGYMERPDITEILELCHGAGLIVEEKDVSFFLGRDSFLLSTESTMARWRKRLFIFLSKNARPATDYFGIPPDQVIEIGSQIRI